MSTKRSVIGETDTTDRQALLELAWQVFAVSISRCSLRACSVSAQQHASIQFLPPSPFQRRPADPGWFVGRTLGLFLQLHSDNL